MKRFLLISFFAIAVSGCGINRQAQQIKALEKCTYRITSAQEIFVGGTNVKQLLQNQEINLATLPGLALSVLRKDVPLRTKLNLEIKNPTGDNAAINEFEYKILINNAQLAEGIVNQEVNVPSGQSVVVPVNMDVNLYPFVSNSKVMGEISEFIKGGKNGSAEKKGILTLKIRPSIKVGGALVKYPGFITIDKEVSSKILL